MRRILLKAAHVGFYGLVLIACAMVLWQQVQLGRLARQMARLTEVVTQASWSAEDARTEAARSRW